LLLLSSASAFQMAGSHPVLFSPICDDMMCWTLLLPLLLLLLLCSRPHETTLCSSLEWTTT
jgi:hypothetical protein